MKRFYLFLLTAHYSLLTLVAQVPQGFNYQAVARNTSGEILTNTSLDVKFGIIAANPTGTLIWEEEHSVNTNEFGLFTVMIGDPLATKTGGSATSFTVIDWSADIHFLKVELDPGGGYVVMGTTQLLSVPYALLAGETANKDDADADPTNELQDINFNAGQLSITSGSTVVIPDNVNDADANATNEIQDLSLAGNTLSLTGDATTVNLTPYLDDTNPWSILGNVIYYNAGNVGIGTDSPGGKLEVVGDGTEAADDPLFEVKRSDGQTVFAVYPEGVRIYVEESNTKGTKGGFAVGGFNPATKGITNEYLRVTPDSVRVYVSEDGVKGTKGGFAVGGFSPSKGITNEYLRISPDSVRVYVNDDGVKGTKGGFAVGGFNPAKGITNEYLRVSPDSVRVYIDEGGAKGTKGGFAVGGFSPAKGSAQDIMRVTIDSTRIYVADSTAGFGIASVEGGGKESFLDLTTENYFIGHESGQQLTTGLYNSILGYKSGFSLSEGDGNSFIGYKSGFANTTGEGNCFMGYESGYSNTTGYKNMFYGYQAGYKNTDGFYNQFFGYKAGFSNTSGGHNVFIGYQSGYHNTSAWTNTFIGGFSGYDNTTGTQNVFLGTGSGASNVNGFNNVYLGYSTGNQNISGNGNVFIGYEAGRNEGGSNKLYIANTNTSTPLIYGDFSSKYLRFYGDMHLYDTYFRIANNPGTGASPAYYVYQGSTGSTTKSGAFAIRDALWVDSRAYFDSFLTTESYININVSGNPSLYVAGDEALWYNGTYFSWGYGGTYNAFVDKVGIGTTGNPGGYALYVNGAVYAASGYASSDARFKEDILEIEQPLQKVLNMEGVNYRWKTEEFSERGFPEGRHYGVIAQEIEKVLPEIVMENNGEKAVAYTEIIPVLIEAMKEQQSQIERQNREIDELKAMMKEILKK